jgi:hypothetical protein
MPSYYIEREDGVVQRYHISRKHLRENYKRTKPIRSMVRGKRRRTWIRKKKMWRITRKMEYKIKEPGKRYDQGVTGYGFAETEEEAKAMESELKDQVRDWMSKNVHSDWTTWIDKDAFSGEDPVEVDWDAGALRERFRVERNS